MRSSTRFGVVAGSASAVVAIAVAFVSIAVHLAIRGDAGNRMAGLRASMVTGVTFGAVMGLFALWYLPIHSFRIAIFVVVAGAVTIVVFGAIASALHGHRDLMAPSRGF